MVITKLVGGIGNQLFQYAVARRIAYLHNTTLWLDISSFERYIVRQYQLNHFNIIENIASAADIKQFKKNSCAGIIKEKFFHFDADILNLGPDVYLEGYWQSEKYFQDIEPVIRREFTVKYELTGKNKEFADYMQNCNSVSLHIRRGDYINNPVVNQVHGTCGLLYYQRCMQKIIELVAEPHFFIFSDDPEWVFNHIIINDYPVNVITHNLNVNDFEDLRLMSMCKHNIIANSSFSWWGAWLNNNPHKQVFAPDTWFRDREMNTRDLIPASWRIMPPA